MTDDNEDGELEVIATAVPTSRQRKEQNRRADKDAEESREFWQRVFADPIGRREMWRVLDQCHPFEERFACGPSGVPQPEATWFHAGQQAFGLRLYRSWLILAREGVLTMQDEHDSAFVKPKKRGD